MRTSEYSGDLHANEVSEDLHANEDSGDSHSDPPKYYRYQESVSYDSTDEYSSHSLTKLTLSSPPKNSIMNIIQEIVHIERNERLHLGVIHDEIKSITPIGSSRNRPET